MKKGILSIGLFAALLTVVAVAAVTVDVKTDMASPVEAVKNDKVSTDWKNTTATTASLGDSASENLDGSLTYQLGDGSKASFKVNKGKANAIPYIRHRGTDYWWLYLKYDSARKPGSTGAYVEFNSASGVKFSSLEWKKTYINSTSTLIVGTMVKAWDSETNAYETVYTHDSFTSSEGIAVNLAKETTSLRVYHYQASGNDTSFLAFSDVTLGVKDYNYSTLTYDTQGGQAMEPAVYGLGEVTTRPTDPTKPTAEGKKYTFGGWYTEPQCQNEFVFGNVLSSDTTIYAKWTEIATNTVKLTFNTNGGEELDPQYAEVGQKFTVPTKEIVKIDPKYTHPFENWYADEGFGSTFDFSVAYTSDQVAYAKFSDAFTQTPIADSTMVNMKKKIFTYGESWSSTTYEDHTLPSSKVDAAMVDSTFAFKGNSSNSGIMRKGATAYDVKIKNATVSWELNDYSKYIKTVRWDIKNTNYIYNTNYTVSLFKNGNATGAAIDNDYMSLVSSGTDRCVQMTDNADQSVNAVSFKNDNSSYYYGFEKLTYVLADVTSTEQQAINFAKAFVTQMTCDGNNITAESGLWNVFASRVEKMSLEAKALLKNSTSSNEDVVAALARYDFIISKYGTESYQNFLDRSAPTSGAFSGLIKNVDDKQTMIAILSALFVSSVIAGVGLVAKKRKER